MMRVSTFTAFTRRQPKTQTTRTTRRTDALKKRITFFRRREATTFEKCLAVHMYYAAKPRRLG